MYGDGTFYIWTVWEPSAHTSLHTLCPHHNSTFCPTLCPISLSPNLSLVTTSWLHAQPVYIQMPQLHGNEENQTPTNCPKKARLDTVKEHWKMNAWKRRIVTLTIRSQW
jgi:hypothetical protein